MASTNLVKREEEILANWKKNNIFKKVQEQTASGEPFVFYEGPPTANGKPGIHHAETRAFKDVIPRFRSMQGRFVDRKGGWDTHGLPVEIEVEKQLGFSGKKDIEAYGIAKFNAKCKENVWLYKEEWEKFTKRLGFWVDLDNPYITYDAKYIESLWAIMKQVWEKDLLYKDYKVVPYCARCGTTLSSHEIAQGYKDVKDLSITAEFVVKEGAHDALRSDVRTALLAWTTTPWTLPGNVGLAVGKNVTYAVIEKDDEGGSGRVRFVLAKDLLETIFADSTYDVVAEMQGSDLVGTTYLPLYEFINPNDKAYTVYDADFVTTDEGTGVVHTAVMYGQDDFELGNKVGLPKEHIVGLDGRFVDGTDFLTGRFVRDEDVAVDIIKDLAKRNLLFAKAKYTHSYPHCWRCKTALIYYAKDSWYIAMSKLRDKLLAENNKINWEPSHIKDGRFGEWLREVKDWAFSRERYWGTPLPLWESQDGDRICIGSFAELKDLAKDKSLISDDFDPHRPFVDDIVLEKDGKEYHRVPDVIDVWFDSGAMPFAQLHYPFENKEKIERGAAYPADYISEAIDQTRGWFYTLLAVATLLDRERPYKNVICLGHLLDAKGEKMSKSKGNIVEPNAMIETYGADAVRWYMYSITQPSESKRFDEKILDEMVKKVFMILTNVKKFYILHGTSDMGHGARVESSTSTHILDRWILARLATLTTQTTNWLEGYKITEPARAIAAFVTDLSTWYVRRSRDRFKNGDVAGIATLHEVLMTLAKLMAPFTPFFADALYLDIGGKKESVHLESWPQTSSAADNALLSEMETVRKIVELGHAARERAGIKVRTPLASCVVKNVQRTLSGELTALIAQELNVKNVELVTGNGQLDVTLDTTLTEELKTEGLAREITRHVNTLRKKEGLAITDIITISVDAPRDVVASLAPHETTIMSGTKASAISFVKNDADEVTIDEHPFRIHIKKTV